MYTEKQFMPGQAVLYHSQMEISKDEKYSSLSFILLFYDNQQEVASDEKAACRFIQLMENCIEV